MNDMRPDRDPHRLVELLRSSVPEGPDPAGRTADVVRRARHANRRRGGVAVVALALTVGVIIGVPQILDQDSRNTPAANGPHHSRATTPTGNGGHTADHGRPVSTLPWGAVEARITPRKNDFSDWVPPIDSLHTDVDSLIDVYNHLPALPPLANCTLEARIDTYHLTFRYPDGRLLTLDGDPAGCSIVNVVGTKGRARTGADRMIAAFFSALWKQRNAMRPPPLPQHPPACPQKLQVFGGVGLSPSGNELHLATASVCAYSQTGELLQYGALTPDEVATLDDDYASRATTARSPCNPEAARRLLIVARTTWLDHVDISGMCGRTLRSLDPEPPDLHYSPSPQVWQLLNAALR
jgi:hypothetical protein